MQKFEAMPHVEASNLMGGYDGMRDESEQSDEALQHDAAMQARAGGNRCNCGGGDDEGAADATDAPWRTLSMGRAPLSRWELTRRFELWTAGRTGYPLVDACMRCLDATGWLTFRMRCLCVSFACFHLWLHWRRPAIWLARRFVDFEPGIHYCQMQMQAGTAEFLEMRVYNPTKQAQEQDPNGTFIKRWLPELRGVPIKWLHEPARMPKAAQREAGCTMGADYPRPVVEHQQAYDRAKRMLQERRNAMGFAVAGGATRKRAAPVSVGSVDLREMFARRHVREEGCEEAAAVGDRPAETPAETPRVAPGADEGTHAAVRVVAAPNAAHDDEAHTRSKLAAAGFPPELARRAASAYPRDVERAADWIMTSDEW